MITNASLDAIAIRKLSDLMAVVCLAYILYFANLHDVPSLCEGNCSHYYYIQPVSAIDCNPLGANLPLTCGVYVPRINPTTVRWYWTGSGELAGVSGTWITDGSPGYSLTAAQSGDPIVNGVYIGLFYDQYSLTILSFNSSDLGYYWCQIVINDTIMLQPSQFLNISVPAVSSTQCLNSAFLFYDFGETCRQQYADSSSPACKHVYHFLTSSYHCGISSRD